MKHFNVIDWVALVLVVVGGLNWGLYGLFHFDLVARIFGEWSMLTRIVYDVVGLSALWVIYGAYRCKEKCKAENK